MYAIRRAATGWPVSVARLGAVYFGLWKHDFSGDPGETGPINRAARSDGKAALLGGVRRRAGHDRVGPDYRNPADSSVGGGPDGPEAYVCFLRESETGTGISAVPG